MTLIKCQEFLTLNKCHKFQKNIKSSFFFCQKRALSVLWHFFSLSIYLSWGNFPWHFFQKLNVIFLVVKWLIFPNIWLFCAFIPRLMLEFKIVVGIAITIWADLKNSIRYGKISTNPRFQLVLFFGWTEYLPYFYGKTLVVNLYK